MNKRETCGLWGCGFRAFTTVTVLLSGSNPKTVAICEYHQTMIEKAAPAGPSNHPE